MSTSKTSERRIIKMLSGTKSARTMSNLEYLSMTKKHRSAIASEAGGRVNILWVESLINSNVQ